MKLKLDRVTAVPIESDYIRLDSLLKLVAAVSTGGEAKIVIQNGRVWLNGEKCVLRGKKLRPGDIARFSGNVYAVTAK